MQKFLMCPPTYFSIDYEINYHMDINHQIDYELAKTQWQKLYDVISEYALIDLLEPQENMPDLVFTANAGLIYNNKVIISRFKNLERQVEEQINYNYFNNQYEIVNFPEIYFEGAGDALYDSRLGLFWCGSGFRSDKESYKAIKDLFNVETVNLNLINSKWYHIDTALCPLSNGYLMYYPGAFDQRSLNIINDYVPSSLQIRVLEKDALNFACNAVNIDNKVIMNYSSENLKMKLNNFGFEPIIVPLSEFLKSGGSAKCLTLKL